MTNRFTHYLKLVVGIHIAILLFLVFNHYLAKWEKPPPKPKIMSVTLAPTIPYHAKSVPTPAPPTSEPKIAEPLPKKKIEVSKKRVKRTPSKPAPEPSGLTREEIKKVLAARANVDENSASVQSDFPTWYYLLVHDAMHRAWKQPAGLSGLGVSAQALIRVQRDGSISRRTLIKSSRNRIMDDSVMQAVQSVSRLKALPAQYKGAYKDITVNFQAAR